ncbi:MAG: M14 family metallopeptidase [Pseudoxanthomonas sp.]
MCALALLATPRADAVDTRSLLPPERPWHGRSESLIAAADSPWVTPAERSGFSSTPRYAQTRAWLEALVAASPLLTLETFGRSAQGRELFYVRASQGGDPKPVVLAQAGIHAGEIDGKDAGLMLLRDIAVGGKSTLLDQVDFVFVPILNVDGHEQTGPLIGAALRGPLDAGSNTTPRGINLNRDYTNLETPETRAIVGLLHTLDPALYIDLHVSGGLDMQYDITFTYAGWGTYARSRATADWLQQRYTSVVSQALDAQGHFPTIYPSLIDEDEPRSGLRYAPEGPRYSTGYGDFLGIPTVLVENHRLKPYRQRVLGDYVLLEASLKLVAQDAARIAQAKRRDRGARPDTLMVKWARADAPIGQVQFKGVSYTRGISPVTGKPELVWEGKQQTWTMPIIGYQQTEAVRYPRAWWIQPGNEDILALLDAHGIAYERVAQPAELSLERYRILREAGPRSVQTDRITAHPDAGAARVLSDQPARMLAAAMLEPRSSDSLLADGRFRNASAPDSGLYGPDEVRFAERMLASDTTLREAFEEKLSVDARFRDDRKARLAWIIERSPYAQVRGWRYPVLRELAD